MKCLPVNSARLLTLVPFVLLGLSACSPANDKTNRSKALFAEDLGNAINTGGVWSNEGGVLTASEDQCLWTTERYSNFILDLEFKNAEGTNSGVILYCSDRENWIPNSVEVQIADDYSEQWSKADPSWQCGAFFGHKAAEQNGVVKPAGEWNQMRIVAKGPSIEVELNGQLVNVIDLGDYTSATLAPDGTKIPAWLSTPWSELAHEGYIGFQGKHAGAPIYFRNIQIEQL